MQPDADPNRPDNYYAEQDYPIGGTHPDYPDLYRVSVASTKQVFDGDDHPCTECPMGNEECDRSCGFAKTWVGPVTWIRIRMMEQS